MAEVSKWLEAREESIFSLETEKTCQVHPTNCLKPRPELKNPRNKTSDGLSNSGLAVRRYSEGRAESPA
jgi:hypothetical protein